MFVLRCSRTYTYGENQVNLEDSAGAIHVYLFNRKPCLLHREQEALDTSGVKRVELRSIWRRTHRVEPDVVALHPTYLAGLFWKMSLVLVPGASLQSSMERSRAPGPWNVSAGLDDRLCSCAGIIFTASGYCMRPPTMHVEY